MWCSGNEAKVNTLLVCICNISGSFLVTWHYIVICTFNIHVPPIWLFHLTRGAAPAAWHHGRPAGSRPSAKGSNVYWSTAQSKLLSTHKFNTIISYLQGGGIKLLREPAVASHRALNNGCRAPARLCQSQGRRNWRRGGKKTKQKKDQISARSQMQTHVCAPLGFLLAPAVIVRVYVTAHTERTTTTSSHCVRVNHCSGLHGGWSFRSATSLKIFLFWKTSHNWPFGKLRNTWRSLGEMFGTPGNSW